MRHLLRQYFRHQYQFNSMVSIIALILLTAATFSARAADDILIADFEGETYGNWQAEGEAFGPGPAQGTLPHQMEISGYQGKRLVNSFFKGDNSQGTLTSPPLTIQRDYINFLIGGGMHPGETCIELLVDGKVACTATGPNDRPGGTEALAWHTWDVVPLKGQKAVIRIVDHKMGGWGHINVDQIVQSDERKMVEPEDLSRDIVLDKQYLLLPIDNEAPRRRMTILTNERPVHIGDINLATDDPDWWTYLDVSEYQGETATITVNSLVPGTHGVKAIETANEPRLPNLYDEPCRPQFHFSQKRGWNNDPNGMVYYDGEYHFFWQSNPFGLKWANMYWGHAVSTDLLHWKEMKLALRPWVQAVDKCFSGSAIVDHDNTSGFQTGDEKVLIASFTDTGCGEAIAYSNDRGRTWAYYDGNPVVEHKGRDPKIIWYAPGKHWVMALYDEFEGKRCMAFYTSDDLKQWTFGSRIDGWFECPEIFELPIDGDPNNTRWVIYAADAQYAIGSFDGKSFTLEHEGKHRVHWGSYYASQTFSDTPDGRRIQVGWARINMEGAPFNQTFSLPTTLTLRTTDEGVRMFAEPIRELEQLRKPIESSKNEPLVADEPLAIDAAGQLYDIVAQIDVGNAKKIEMRWGTNVVTYDVSAQKLDEMPLALEDNKLSIRVLVDRPMFEIVGQHGRVYKTSARKDTGRALGEISVTAVGGDAVLEQFDLFEMQSIWK